jgi:probable addiction module antidote protein
MPKRTRDYREGLLNDLKDATAAAHYLNAALEDSDEMFLVALRDVAEARQMAKVAERAQLSRESIYRMLTETGNPRYSSLLGILKALGLKLEVAADAKEGSRRGKRVGEHRLHKRSLHNRAKTQPHTQVK